MSAAEPPHGSAAGAAVVAPGLEVAEPGVDEGDVPRLYVTAGGAAMVGTVEAAGGQLEYPLREQVITMGTSEQADLRLAGEVPAVEYAELRRTPDGEQYEIRSLHTPTVVLVNGQPVAEARLEDGYRIEVGGVALVYRSHSHPRGDVGRQGGEGSGHPNEI